MVLHHPYLSVLESKFRFHSTKAQRGETEVCVWVVTKLGELQNRPVESSSIGRCSRAWRADQVGELQMAKAELSGRKCD